MIEKRNSARFSIRLPARYRILNSSGYSYEATVVNLGTEGICFLFQGKLEATAEIELQIQLDTHETVTLKARVVWLESLKERRQSMAGVKIIDATQEDEEKFIKFYCHNVLIAPKSKPKILIIDDEKDMVSLLRIELEQQNYIVLCAYDGLEGYDTFLKERPDLIILDLMLPKLNGYSVCRKIRNEEKNFQVPILMLTAKKEDEDRIIGRVIGAQKYMTKPFEIQYLLKEIHGLLNQKG